MYLFYERKFACTFCVVFKIISLLAS